MLEVFRKFNRDYPNNLAAWKQEQPGRRVFGWLCTYIPEEIIHAAGILPVRITGYSREEQLDDGTAYLTANTCSFSRSCLQFAFDGGYDFLDGIVGGSTCDGARRLFDQWVMYRETPFFHMLTVPRKSDEGAQALYRDQVTGLKQRLEEYVGTAIPDERLLDSIEVYNESRALLRRFYELRRQQAPPVTGAEAMEVLNASFRMPKELFNESLRNLLDELQGSEERLQGRDRVMLSGSVMTSPEFVRSIEEAGALVVTDELCTGTRYWSDPVVMDSAMSPLEAVSRRYLNNFPCARMTPAEDRFQRILKLAADYNVEGVISEIVRYCVPYAHDLPLLKDRLNAAGIPLLALDLEYGSAGSGQVRTRVQAFIEMLEAKRR